MRLHALELGAECGLGLAKLLSQGANMTKTSWWCMLLCLSSIFHRQSPVWGFGTGISEPSPGWVRKCVELGLMRGGDLAWAYEVHEKSWAVSAKELF